jgi:hypothetical protein
MFDLVAPFTQHFQIIGMPIVRVAVDVVKLT